MIPALEATVYGPFPAFTNLVFCIPDVRVYYTTFKMINLTHARVLLGAV